MRDGPNDYIYLRGGTKKLVRSLQPDGNYRVTKLGKSFFRDKWTDYLARVPVRIRGRRRNGRPYERETLLPVTLDGAGAPERLAGRGAGAPQRHRRRSAQDGRSRRRRRGHGDLRGDLHLRRLAGLGRLEADHAGGGQSGRDRGGAQPAPGRVAGRVLPALQGLRNSGERLRAEGGSALRGAPALGTAAAALRGGLLGLRRDLPQELGAQGRHRGRDPGVLRLAQGAAVHRQLPRADARLLRAGRQGAAARGLLHLPRSRLLLPQRRRRVLLRRRGAGPAQLPGRSARVHRAAFSGLEAVERGDRARALLVRGRARGPGRAAGAGAPAEGRDARLGGVAVPAPEGQGRRLRRPRVSRRRGGAREVDDQAGLRLPGPAPGRGRQRGLRRALEG